MDVHMRLSSYRTIRWKQLSNFTTDDLNHAAMWFDENLGLKQFIYGVLLRFSFIF